MKKIIDALVRSDLIWWILKHTILPPASYALASRRRYRKEKWVEAFTKTYLDEISPDKTVKYGSFKGLKYPDATWVWGNVFPKLLGSYERELEPVWARVADEKFSEIIDVGCADGYYAVGLARKFPDAKIYAYDTNDDAIAFCRRMAVQNRVEERMIYGSMCDLQTLLSIPVRTKALVICDCEGYEKELLQPIVAERYAKHSFLVEIHDFIDIDTSRIILDRFEKTHWVETYESLDDLKKIEMYHYDELLSLDRGTKWRLLREGRPCTMKWYYMYPRDTAPRRRKITQS